jgi:hypothetical protein
MRISDGLVIGSMFILMASLAHLIVGHWTDSMQWLCIGLLGLTVAGDRNRKP